MTVNNLVLATAVVIGASWAWSSVEVVQRNYQLQKLVDDKKRLEKLVRLETENLQFEQNYYKSNEYLSLEAKRRLGLAEPGEKALILPPNSAAVKAEDQASQSYDASRVSTTIPPPPLEQWIDFLFANKPHL